MVRDFSLRWRSAAASAARGALLLAALLVSDAARAQRQADAAEETLAGNVVDAFAITGGADDGVWLSVTSAAGRSRRLVKAGTAGAVSRAVPARAVFVDGCPGAGIVFADNRGLVDLAGKRLLSGAALFSIADPEQLLVAELCSRARSLMILMHAAFAAANVTRFEVTGADHTFSSRQHSQLVEAETLRWIDECIVKNMGSCNFDTNQQQF